MLSHAIAHGGCTDNKKESALKVDSGKKIPCLTGESNQRLRRDGADAVATELHPIPIPFGTICNTDF